MYNTESLSVAAPWLALMIGNSRWHWAQFAGQSLQHAWNSEPLSQTEVQDLIATGFASSLPATIPDRFAALPLWIASVVPAQTEFWKAYSAVHIVTLDQVPLQAMYPTLGIDRALALWGAIALVGGPVLVIDAGTALTFTGADDNHGLIGGAILPGLGLQFRTLNQATAALPSVETQSGSLPSRWARNTSDAIASGIFYTLLAGVQAFITDWWQQFPGSPVLLCGGDSDRLHAALRSAAPDLAEQITLSPHLIFWGLRSMRDRYQDTL